MALIPFRFSANITDSHVDSKTIMLLVLTFTCLSVFSAIATPRTIPEENCSSASPAEARRSDSPRLDRLGGGPSQRSVGDCGGFQRALWVAQPSAVRVGHVH